VAKRKKKPTTAKKPPKKPPKKPTKKPTKKTDAPPKKGTAKEKPSDKPKDGAKLGGAAEPDRAASRAGAATLLPPTRPRTTTRSQKTGGTASGPVTSSDRDTPAIDAVRMINNADRVTGGSCPMQTGEHAPPTHAVQIAEGAAEQEDRLEEIAPHLSDADKDDLLRAALWLADRARLPRAAIVGRALHELKSFTEADASSRGTADQICEKINHHNNAHLSKAIQRVRSSSKDPAHISAALAGHLKRAWLVLQELKVLKAAYRSGVYLNGVGQRVFDGFPDWNKPDEKLPEKLTRPPKRSRS
jgi:hypothetical protein